MSVIAICGLPGSGKTLFATYLAMKKYKRDNFLKKGVNNLIFSNYPILLDRKHKVFSNKVGLSDFDKYQKWEVGSTAILDEFQLYFDSLDFKNFPKKVRNNFQLHRHFGIDDIYLLSQHPSRIVKQARVLVCEFYDIVNFFKFPLLPYAFVRYNVYYNYEDFGKSVKVKPQDVPYNFKKKIRFFNYKKVYKAYDTCYMYSVVKDKPYIIKDFYLNSQMDLLDIYNKFNFLDSSDL